METKKFWFFDFLSPFSYLQLDQLNKFENVQPKPILLAALLNHWGHKGPAEIESKREFTYRNVIWIASKMGQTLKIPNPHPFNPLAALRLVVYLKNDIEAITKIFHIIWEKGYSPAEDVFWEELKKQEIFSGDLSLLKTDEIKFELKANCDLAISKGVFGVPTLLVHDKIFWGLDATDFAIEFNSTPTLFNSGEYLEFDKIKIGAKRT